MSVQIEPELATPAEAAIELRTSVPTVKRWCREGRIGAIKLPGGEWRIPLWEIRGLYVPRRTVPAPGHHRRLSDRGAV
jgi:excisionase family DNA binding protein